MSAAPRTRIAFIGLGAMGWPMAARLVAAGHDVVGVDAVPGRAAQFAATVGGTAALEPSEAAQGAAMVVTILPTSRQVEQVIDAMRPALKSGTLVIEMTSGQPAVTRRLATDLASAGVMLVDAPVSGGVPRARDGTLAIMAGGSAAALDRAEPVLRAMGTTIHRVGDVGAGQAMKALNNLVSAGGFLIGIEALLIGQRAGLDPAAMVDVLNASSGMTNSSKSKFKQFVLSRRFDAGFGLDLMVKDLTIATEIGRDTATPAPFAALCREMWAAAAGMLGPGHDHTALALFSERLVGESLAGQGPEHPKEGA